MNKSYIEVCDLEIRVLNSGSVLIKGMLPTNTKSGDIYSKEKRIFFREIIKDGCFDKILSKETPKILLQHKADKEQKLVSFEGKETNKGLRFQAEIIPTEELIKNITKVTGLSFGFVKKTDNFKHTKEGWIRTILEFESMSEISILYGSQIPAYPSSVIIAEDEEKLRQGEISELKKLINKERAKSLREELNRLKKGR